MTADHTTAIFVAELIVLLMVGRLLGEAMNRMGQPAIFGQLLGGIVLGPSVFGALAPDLQHVIFPNTPALKSMIDALSQVGVLLLLLVTGMETNFAIIATRRRAVISTSLFGIAVPFVCGVALAYALPATIIPSPSTQFVTALFIGTALSISSVKIVAIVLMEVGAIRRSLGQLILATAVLDDTIAWIIIAVIAGLAAHGSVSLAALGSSVGGTFVFLALCFFVGRRTVATLIRWTNDNLTIEVPVITTILVIMLLMALATELIGVHTALGAFVAGTLIGQSPILTEHIEGELRGFILAFFSPIFFAVAGLGMNLNGLMNPTLLLFTLAIIMVASLGKFVGAFIGGRLGGLSMPESLTLGAGLNARGSTEVIIASIGLSMGVLSNELYTMIVAMAVITTLAMPPTLRWMLARVPISELEAKRMEKEDAEEKETVPNIERALVLLDDSPNASLTALLAGTFAASRQVVTTIVQVSIVSGKKDEQTSGFDDVCKAAAVVLKSPKAPLPDTVVPRQMGVEELFQVKPFDTREVIAAELANGYGIAFVGVRRPVSESGQTFDTTLAALVSSFDSPVAIALNGPTHSQRPGRPLNILVPTSGTQHARMAIEVALALTKATGGTLTVLHVFEPHENTDFLRGRADRVGKAVLVDARQLGKRSGVTINFLTSVNVRPEIAIRRAASAGRFDLLLLGASLRVGNKKFLGPASEALVRTIKIPILLVAQ